MDETERGHAGGIVQIVIEASDLRCEQQPLVDHRPAGKARHVKLGQAWKPMFYSEVGQRVLGLLANSKQLAFKRILIGAAFAATHEKLPDDRHRGNHGLAKPVERRRHVAPAKRDLAFLAGKLLESFDHKISAGLVLRKEAHGHGIIARLGQGEPLAISPLSQQPIGHLDEDAGPVAKQRIGADRAAMIEISQDFQCL